MSFAVAAENRLQVAAKGEPSLAISPSVPASSKEPRSPARRAAATPFRVHDG